MKTGRGALLVGAIVVAAIVGFGSPAAAQFPLGTWDVKVTGAAHGQAYIDFVAVTPISGTLTAYGVIVPNREVAPTGTINFGFFVVDGQWQMLPNGEVVGFWQSPPADDVRLDVSDFTANGRDATRIKLAGESTNGKIVLTGVPLLAIYDDLTGTWSADVLRTKGTTQTRNFIIFDLTPTATFNVYDLVGFGADRCVFGAAMLSRGNRVGFVTREFEVPDPPDDCTTLDPNNPPAGLDERFSGAIGNVRLRLGTFTGRASGRDETVEGEEDTKVRMDVLRP